MQALEPNQIEAAFNKLPVEWSLVAGNRLELTQEFPNFSAGLQFVNKIGDLAEEHDHHPDITLSYSQVGVALTTHSADGLTVKDFELAQAIQKIIS